jgi:hypothetical protein
MTATHWRLPYRAYENRVPATEQDRREAMIETIVAEYIETDDEVTFEQLLVIRPDLTHSAIWEAVEHLCGRSVEVAFWEDQPGREAFDTAVDDYAGALYTFAGVPVAVSS